MISDNTRGIEQKYFGENHVFIQSCCLARWNVHEAATFQQLDRSQTKLSSMLSHSISPLHWGIRRIEVNNELLSLGKISITYAEGILQDRTPFELPLLAELPEVKDVDPSIADKVIYLCCHCRPSARVVWYKRRGAIQYRSSGSG